jgi:zinc D-Ala-D-Ala carboxypeptidase
MNYGKYFKESEFVCSHTGEVKMDQSFLDLLNALRETYGKPLRITSGYRHPTHPIEAKKKNPGAHTTGKAVDIAVNRGDAYNFLLIALNAGCTGIGVAQKGNGRFIHIDTLTASSTHPRPTIWSY